VAKLSGELDLGEGAVSDTSESFDELLRRVAAAPDITGPLVLEVGTVVAGRYRVLASLGRGAMGSVYEVADTQLDERIALKLLHPALSSDPEYQKALRREVRLARRVSHPNVCRVHDIGMEDSRLFVTMELLDGECLRDHVARAQLSLSRKIDILVQLASGLAAAHRAGVIHRDVKPDNVVLDGERAVLTDFGVASLTRGAPSERIAGTPAYMAPELALGKSNDQRVDTYSFGVLAYELLAGQRPAAIRSLGDVRALVESGAKPRLPPEIAERDVRDALEAVLRRALDVDPERRPDPIDTLATLLSRAAGGETPGMVMRRPRRSARSNRAATAVVVSFAAASDDTEALERPIARLGGTVTTANRYRLEALFGAPRSRGDDAIRAAAAARAIAESSPGASIAIHTGLVELSSDTRGALLATGPALERARDLAGDAGVWCSRETRAQLAGHFTLEPGIEDRYQITGPAAGLAAITAPLSGRAAEIAQLEDLAAQTFAERRPHFVRITGAAGIGKTRLVAELLERIAARREVDVLSLRAAPFADAGPLGLLRQAQPDTDHPEALRGWLLDRAARRPLVLVADDLQWADAASREFLSDLERQVDDAALLALFVAREPSALWPESSRSLAIALEPLRTEAARDLLIGVAPMADTEAIAQAALRTGNPLLLEELGRALREGRKSLPDTVVAAAQEALDQLDERHRDIARRAAVLGGDFTAAELSVIADVDTVVSADTEGAIAELVNRALLVAAVDERGDVRYRFASPLIRDTAYELAAAEERLRWHGAAAVAITDRPRTSANLRALADHWERAGQLARAREALVAAGEMALDRYAFDEAAAALLRAEQLTGTNDDLEVELLMHLGLALEPSDGAAAEERFARAFHETAAGDRRRPRLCLCLGRRATAHSDNDSARRWYERGLAEIDKADPPAHITIRAALYGNLGSLLGYVMNDNATGLELSERAVALLEGTEYRRELAGALSRLGGNYMRAGRIADQLECNRRNLDIAFELGDLTAELTARVNLGEAHKTLGEIDEALEHTRAAVALSRRIGNSAVRALALSNLGLLLIEVGDLDVAADRFAQAIELGKRTGFDRFFYESYCGLARIYFLRGDHDAAEEHARKAVGIAMATGSEVIEGIALRFLAAARAARGHADDALGNIRRAHRCLEDRDAMEDARTSVVEVRILAGRGSDGDRDQSQALLARARDVFGKLGARLDLVHLDHPDDLR
jgi:tetratricopeptide (TPR) repeat protein/tRNA A-37 threonylcarbamoyl transferase component Bud32